MDFNYTAGMEIFNTNINNVNVIGIDYFVAIIVVLLTALIITRDIEEWKILLFPISLAWWIAGLNVPIVLIIVAAVIFGIEALSTTFVGNVIENLSFIKKIKQDREFKKSIEQGMGRLRVRTQLREAGRERKYNKDVENVKSVKQNMRDIIARKELGQITEKEMKTKIKEESDKFKRRSFIIK